MTTSLPTFRSLVFSMLLFTLLTSILPIPARSQSSNSGIQVQFPTSSAACVACKPAFSTAACQTILNSITQGSTAPISNTTLTACQCSPSFLSLYNTCVQCFTETNQVDIVFGSNQAPSQSSLDTYCKSFSSGQATVTVTMTVTKTTHTPTSTSTSTSTPSNPSSATALKVYHEGQPANAVMMYTVVAVMALVYFSILS
ncbi:hypothetical protein EDD21DRAFT_414350 [Dissophora ornata]|nr:hypothetical protein BGZ58_009295 [Dissophora ornata]KAI8602049.1 hypothetical protein EDD21DRAFT_414350 [Dissophora ornata]